jgi:hypothetical protein
MNYPGWIGRAHRPIEVEYLSYPGMGASWGKATG